LGFKLSLEQIASLLFEAHCNDCGENLLGAYYGSCKETGILFEKSPDLDTNSRRQ